MSSIVSSREQVMTALLAALTGLGEFKTVSRRNRDPNTIGPAQSPAVFLLEDSEQYEIPSPSLPPKRHLLVNVIFYNDIGNDQTLIPATAINDALDALDLCLSQRSPFGLFNLNGLVYSVTIDGEVKKAPGDKTGKSVAVVPLRIVLP